MLKILKPWRECSKGTILQIRPHVNSKNSESHILSKIDSNKIKTPNFFQ